VCLVLWLEREGRAVLKHAYLQKFKHVSDLLSVNKNPTPILNTALVVCGTPSYDFSH